MIEVVFVVKTLVLAPMQEPNRVLFQLITTFLIVNSLFMSLLDILFFFK